MSASIYSELSWLPAAAADFNERCRALRAGADGELGRTVRALANQRLDGNQLVRLARTMDQLRAEGRSLRPLQEFRLALISNATTDFLAPAIVASAARHGFAVELIRGHYGQVMQDALMPDSVVNAAKPAAVLLAIDHRWFPLQTCPGDTEQAERVVRKCMEQFRSLCEGVRAASAAVCIVQTLAAPVEGLFGSLDRAIPGTLPQLIDALNVRIAAYARESENILLDLAGLAQTVGLAEWHDPAAWNLAKLPFAQPYLPLFAEHVGRLIGALRGKSRRCLILDLDNTLWGGVIGDDGLDGIQIAQGDATGEAYLEVQRLALTLRSRGIVLAVCSKNTDEVARRPFREHPEMLLKLEHIAVFQANWNDKATNIKAIADELSLGLESMVFLDDNPMERDIVRQMLPEVAVPELPQDPAYYARTLNAGGYFETTRFSAEDLTRADFYQDNSRRAALREQAGDLDSYLASLEMEISFQPFDETGRARIAQLISKSNQFNLTTRRYTEAQVAAMQDDPSCFTLQVRLKDIFGDNGMISVVICRKSAQTVEIDTWLMSCRVLGRRVENIVLQEIVDYARRVGAGEIIGRYIPSERNALVEHHYEKLGFGRHGSGPDGSTVWRLDVAQAPAQTAPMTVHRTGYAVS